MNALRFSLVLSVLASTALAAPLPVTSSITAATVYADRAVVTRTGRVDLPAGQTELTFPGLPPSAMDNSFQVNGRGVPATILDVSSRILYTDVTPDPRVKALEDELAGLTRQDRTLQDKLAVLDQQRALLAKIETATTQPAPKDATAPRPTFEDWQKLLTFSADNAARLATERQSLEQQREDLARKVAATQSQLGELRRQLPGTQASKTVTVRVSTVRAGALDVTLAYALPGAAWSPAYDARLHTDTRTIEDWQNVALTLSTARPNLGGGAPELTPWFLEVIRYQEESKGDGFSFMSRKPKRPDPSSTLLGAEGLQAFNGIALAEASMDRFAPAESSVSLATLDTGATSASFKIPVAATILSDNSPQKVGITTATLDAKLQYQAVPKLLETAFLGAYTVNTTDFPWIAGPVSTFLDTTFVATGTMKTVMPGEKFSLDLGADEGVAIKRKLVNRFTEETGFTGKSRRVTYEFLLTVTNNKRTAERVVFKDALPVSRDEKIVVKLLAPAEREVGTKDKPGREVTLEEDGKLVWRLDLKPGEKREIPLKFSIEHPVELSISGIE
jgi:uncharacterized protein (TIGR02231 family)